MTESDQQREKELQEKVADMIVVFAQRRDKEPAQAFEMKVYDSFAKEIIALVRGSK